MHLLDTSIVSELRKARPHGAVSAWFRFHRLQELFLPSIALYEMQGGVELTRNQDPQRAETISHWIDQIATKIQVLPLDAFSARLAAKFMHGKMPQLTGDAMIAAIAVTNRLVVATRNTKDFNKFPVAQIDPFQFEGP
jgi:hypothetical protein